MNKRILFYTYSIISFNLLLSNVYAGNIEGNIVRINLENNAMTELDSICWHKSDTFSYYISAFSVDTNSYLIKHCSLGYDNEGPLEQIVVHNKIFNTNTNRSTTYLYISNFIRLLGLVPSPPYIYKTGSGTWLFNDLLGRAFVTKLDSIYQYHDYDNNKLIHIAGQIESEHLAVIYDQEKDSLYYFLNELDSLPNYNQDSLRKLYIDKNDMVISQIMNIDNDIYILNDNHNFLFYKAILLNDTLKITNELDLDQTWQSAFSWFYKNESLYILYDDKIYKYNYASEDTTFINKKMLISGDLSIDFTQLMASKIEDNQLLVYDMKEEVVHKSISLDSINYSSSYSPLIDYPYVYIHQIKKYSIIERKSRIPSEYCLLQNYPNPFNPSTNIKFYLPEKSYVTLKVFNTLGQNIVTLLDKEISAGNHIIEFNGKNLNSGVYFYRLNTRGFQEVKKMILFQ